MSRIVFDAAVLAKLREADQLLEVCDDAGKVVGHFIPAVPPEDPLDLEPRITQQEMERRELAGGGRSLKAILADLEKRA